MNNPMQTALTPAQAGRICGLSHGTITRCFDRGLLKGFKVPGSKFRRIPLENLRKFMREYGIPCDQATSELALSAKNADAVIADEFGPLGCTQRTSQ